MDKQIYFQIDKSLNTSNYSVAAKSSIASSFQNVLTSSLDKIPTIKETTTSRSELSASFKSTQDASERIFVGTTSKAAPTVSHVLLNNDDLKQNSWDIIYSNINKEKKYTSVPLGASVYYDKESGELSWAKDGRTQDQATNRSTETMPIFSHTPTSKTVSLGKVNAISPTVSHLLATSQEHSSEKWNILSASINSKKNFSTIPQNTEIWFNEVTKELSWQGSGSLATPTSHLENKLVQLEHQAQSPLIKMKFTNHDASAVSATKDASTQPIGKTDRVPPDLTEAVKPFIGTSYDKIDCYGLVINGLKEMGLPYSGEGGLRNKLTAMAKQKGLPTNAYLTGEGIVEATGKQVFTHSSTSISNWTTEADKIYQDMKQLLQKGQILSFSTPTRGHTGIISQHNEKWTFINSGRMDNHVAEANRSKEVGEEDLVNEVQNWFKLAKKNREPLLVTLGQIEEDKIRTTIQPNFQISQRI